MPKPEDQFPVGTVVRDRRHQGQVGTVTRLGEDGVVYVAWYGTCVESDPHISELDVWEDAPAEYREWRGGFGVMGRGKPFEVIPSAGL